MVGALWVVAAMAGVDARVGVGLGLSADLPDGASAGETRLRPGGYVGVPVRLDVAPLVRLRGDVRLELAGGVDELTWDEAVDGATVRRTDADGHLAIVGALGFELGASVYAPVAGRARPFLGLGGGLMAVGVYHALRDETAVLLDPTQNDLGNPRNIDPYTVQAVGTVHVVGGVDVRLTRRVELSVEVGYGSALVGARALRKTAAASDARREAFGWNPLRAGLAVTVGVGRRKPEVEKDG